jgi:hypothetical protein
MAGEARGRARETATARLLRAEGWICLHVKTGRERGDEIDFEPPDLVASRDRHDGFSELWWLEVKSTARPWERFGPERRARLIAAARKAGVDRVTLAHWPKGQREPVFVDSSDWPV